MDNKQVQVSLKPALSSAVSAVWTDVPLQGTYILLFQHFFVISCYNL